jgi:hypothetical protein
VGLLPPAVDGRVGACAASATIEGIEQPANTAARL